MTDRPGRALEWRRGGLRVREWTLLDGDELVADLGPSEWRRFDARGESRDGVWLFRRRPWRPWVDLEVVDPTGGGPVARYRGLGWRRGTIRIGEDGRRLEWARPSFLSGARTLRTPSGDPVISVRNRPFRGLFRITVRAHRDHPELLLLLVVTGYLHLRIHAGGASPTKPFGGGRKGWEPLELPGRPEFPGRAERPEVGDGGDAPGVVPQGRARAPSGR